MGKVTQEIKVKSNFENKPFSFAANILLLLASNRVECCKPFLCTETTKLSLGELSGQS